MRDLTDREKAQAWLERLPPFERDAGRLLMYCQHELGLSPSEALETFAIATAMMASAAESLKQKGQQDG